MFGKMEPNILELFKMITGMDTDKWLGMMAESTKDSGSTVLKKMCK